MDKTKEISSYYSDIISDIGEDVKREGLIKTPERAAKSYTVSCQWLPARSYSNHASCDFSRGLQ